jgi:hypothetical protein
VLNFFHIFELETMAMALTVSVTNQTWKKATNIMLALSLLIFIVGLIMKMNSHPNAGLLLVVASLPFLLTLFMRWIFRLAGK